MSLLNTWNGIISLFIACIEILLLVNLLIFAEKNKVNKIIFLIVALLACYQAFEFLICNLGMDSSFTAYLAFAVISFLPPLNLLLVFNISGLRLRYPLKKSGSDYNHEMSFQKSEPNEKSIKGPGFLHSVGMTLLIFLPAIFFIIYYLSVIEYFIVVKCTVLYAAYNYPLGDLYGFFYYLPVIISFIILIKKRNGIEKKQFIRLLLAHIFIIVPIAAGFSLLYLDFPGLIYSMESILCKFAFGYAIFLALYCLNNRVYTS